MGEITELFIIMFLVAAGAFAPLAYFIYRYTQRGGEPFGDIEAHDYSPSKINDLAEKAIGFLKGLLGKKSS